MRKYLMQKIKKYEKNTFIFKIIDIFNYNILLLIIK